MNIVAFFNGGPWQGQMERGTCLQNRLLPRRKPLPRLRFHTDFMQKISGSRDCVGTSSNRAAYPDISPFVVHVSPPPPVGSVYQYHSCKDVSKFSRDIGQKLRIEQQCCTQYYVEDGHSRSDDKKGIAESATLADAFISSGHGRRF